jgi:hypothetical protein
MALALLVRLLAVAVSFADGQRARRVPMCAVGIGLLGFLGRPASESGGVCREDGGQGRADRRQMALLSAPLPKWDPVAG